MGDQRVIQDKQGPAPQIELIHDTAIMFVKYGIELTGCNDILHAFPDPFSQFGQLRIHVEYKRKLIEQQDVMIYSQSVTPGCTVFEYPQNLIGAIGAVIKQTSLKPVKDVIKITILHNIKPVFPENDGIAPVQWDSMLQALKLFPLGYFIEQGSILFPDDRDPVPQQVLCQQLRDYDRLTVIKFLITGNGYEQIMSFFTENQAFIISGIFF